MSSLDLDRVKQLTEYTFLELVSVLNLSRSEFEIFEPPAQSDSIFIL